MQMSVPLWALGKGKLCVLTSEDERMAGSNLSLLSHEKLIHEWGRKEWTCRLSSSWWVIALLLPIVSRKYSLILLQLGPIIVILMERSHHVVLSTASIFKTSVKTLFRNNLMPFRLHSHVFWFLSFWLFPLPVVSAWLNLMYSMLCSLKCLAWMVCLMRNHLSWGDPHLWKNIRTKVRISSFNRMYWLGLYFSAGIHRSSWKMCNPFSKLLSGAVFE